MSIRDRYKLTRVINARGTFTPLGVSRSSPEVTAAVAEALANFVVIDELQDAASEALAAETGAEAGTVVHCAAAGITLAIAACMAGQSDARIAALPDATGMPDRVVIPAGHLVNYGHPITQAIRLSGACPVTAGTEARCGIAEIEDALDHPDTCCLLLVASRLTRGAKVDFSGAISAAKKRGVPTLIDAAAQDMRMRSLLATGVDLLIVSAQKYLAAPTAGLVMGRKQLVQAVRAQERGIGRCMKASKEAVFGVLAALEQRRAWSEGRWSEDQSGKLARFIEAANRLPGVAARSVPDPAGLPFSRAHLEMFNPSTGMTAASVVESLESGNPPVYVMDHMVAENEVVMELVQLSDDEITLVLKRLASLLN